MVLFDGAHKKRKPGELVKMLSDEDRWTLQGLTSDMTQDRINENEHTSRRLKNNGYG